MRKNAATTTALSVTRLKNSMEFYSSKRKQGEEEKG
jgi:hypothetical protein